MKRCGARLELDANLALRCTHHRSLSKGGKNALFRRANVRSDGGEAQDRKDFQFPPKHVFASGRPRRPFAKRNYIPSFYCQRRLDLYSSTLAGCFLRQRKRLKSHFRKDRKHERSMVQSHERSALRMDQASSGETPSRPKQILAEYNDCTQT